MRSQEGNSSLHLLLGEGVVVMTTPAAMATWAFVHQVDVTERRLANSVRDLGRGDPSDSADCRSNSSAGRSAHRNDLPLPTQVTPVLVIPAVCVCDSGRFVLSAQAACRFCTLTVSYVCPTTFAYMRSVLSTCAGTDAPGLGQRNLSAHHRYTTVAQGANRHFAELARTAQLYAVLRLRVIRSACSILPDLEVPRAFIRQHDTCRRRKG